MIKNKIALAALTTGCLGVVLGGCTPREETVVVQQEGPGKVVEKTTVKKVPKEQPKTIIVKPAPQPKTTTETNVNVVVKPTPKPVAPKLPEPAPQATPAAKPSSTPRPEATATPKPKVALAEKPKPTATPKPAATPKAAATPRPQAASAKGLVVRAEVVATSKVPDPKSVPYKDSLVFTKYKVLDVENGEYKEKEILVAQWGMKDKKLQPAARNRVGQVQTLSLEPLSSSMESVMRNDDTNAFDLDPYFAR